MTTRYPFIWRLSEATLGNNSHHELIPSWGRGVTGGLSHDTDNAALIVLFYSRREGATQTPIGERPANSII